MKYVFMIIILFVVSCKKQEKKDLDNGLIEIKEYYGEGEMKSIDYLTHDSAFLKSVSFYKSGKLESEYSPKEDGVGFSLIKYYEKGGVLSYSSHNVDGSKNGEKREYHKNGKLKYRANYRNDTLQGEFIAYDESLNLDYYFRFNHLGEKRYQLDVDSVGNVIIESPHKFAYIGLNVVSDSGEFIGLMKGDSLTIDIELANPPGCKKKLVTKLNGVIKKNVNVSGMEYSFKVLPSELGRNKLELLLDYSCEDYKLQSDYFFVRF